MMRDHAFAALVLAALVAACGGSGSTGLVSPEGALLREVRRDGTCVTSEEMVTYCATGSPDAVSPGGVSGVGPFDSGGPQTTATPGAPASTTSAGGAGETPTVRPTGTAAPAGSATPIFPTSVATPVAETTPTVQATPCQTATGACPAPVDLQFVVRGLPEGAACALAARALATDDSWSTGALVAVGGAVTDIELSLPGNVGPGPVEIAVLCFAERPLELPAQLPTLASASPDVVFVPADPVIVPVASAS